MKVSQSPFSNDHPLPATPCSSKTLPPFRAPRAPGHFTSYLLDQALSFPPRYFPIMVSLCFYPAQATQRPSESPRVQKRPFRSTAYLHIQALLLRFISQPPRIF